MAWYSQRANFFTSNVVPREEHLHGWEGALTVSNPSGGGGHAEIVFTVEGVGCATVGKGQQHVFTINEHNNNAASRFVINYMLMDGEWGEVPATPSVVGGTTSSSVGLEPYGSIVVVPTALLAVNACTITLGTKIESITATLRGINESSGYAATPIVRPNQHKYFYLNGKAPEALQGELPINDAGEPTSAIDDRYTPGWLSPYNFGLHKTDSWSGMRLPFASAGHGARPMDEQGRNDPTKWSIERSGRPLGNGNSYKELATGMYTRGDNTRRAGAHATIPRASHIAWRR